MAIKQLLYDIDGVKLGKLINWRNNPLTTIQRITLGLSLSAIHSGLECWDTDENIKYVWNGSVWIPINEVNITIVNVLTTTHNATQTSGHVVLLVDAAAAGGNVTVNLPTAIGNTAMFTIKKIDNGPNTVTADGFNAETIDGSLIAPISVPNLSISLVNNNANWFVI